MGTIKTKTILERCQDMLGDQASGTRWGIPSLMRLLNRAQLSIVVKKPSANITSASTVLVAGPRQSLPAGALQLIDIPYNMGVAPGTTIGRVITRVMKDFLDRSGPGWALAALADDEVIHYSYDLSTPTVFWVYPSQPASGFGYVYLVYSAVPTEATITGAITIGDQWDAAIEDYILWRAFGKDAAISAAAQQRAQFYQAAFMNEIGEKVNAEKATEQEAYAK